MTDFPIQPYAKIGLGAIFADEYGFGMKFGAGAEVSIIDKVYAYGGVDYVWTHRPNDGWEFWAAGVGVGYRW